MKLPLGVTFDKEMLSYGMAYVFRHEELGLLGRIILQETKNNQCHISYEIAGEGNDPMSKKREKFIIPIHKEIIEGMNNAFGKGTENVPPPINPHRGGEYIKSKMLTCPQCDAGVVLIIFADKAKNVGEMEDYARKMFKKVEQMNLPTYIIRPATEKGNSLSADILKIWPHREAVEHVNSIDDFYFSIDTFIGYHCK